MKPNDESILAGGQHAIRTKLNAPLATPFQVVRQQIYDKVVAAGTRLILIRGPAGFGKTTVMLQLRDMYQQTGAATSWLTLDDADNDVPRFLSFLSQTIESIRASGRPADVPMFKTAANMGDVALSVVADIADLPGPFVIFLDDFEAISNPVVLGLVTRIVESLPAHGRIVIGSRNIPDIGLGRLRAKGHLTDIDSVLLRFSVEEAKDFLQQRRGLSLSLDQVARLHQNTEGWVTAISLASMVLERGKDAESFIGSFSGSNATIADYLAEDVLSRLPDALRDFLLKSSILDELSESLCNAVCGRNNSQEILQQLERANLFLIPLDEDRKWYRYHSLFASFLRSQLARQFPDQTGSLHHVAAEWYLMQDRPIPAIQHALSSGDNFYAVSLLGRHVNALLDQGRLRLLARWLDSLPPRTLEGLPKLRIAHAWAVAFTRGAREALTLVEGLHAEALEGEPLAHLCALRPMLLAMMDGIEESYELGIDALPVIPARYGFAQGMLAQALTYTCIIKGQFADALKYADQARKTLEGETRHFNMVLAESAEATMELMQGRLRQSTVRLRMIADSNDPDVVRGRYGNAFWGVLFAETLYEADECEQARRLLETYMPLARDLALPDTLIRSHVLLARIVSRQGDHDRALQLLTELESVGHRLGLPRVLASARLERAKQALLQNDMRRAEDQLSNAGDPVLWQQISRQWFIANDTATLALGRLRWMIRSGAAAQALPALKQELEEAELGQRHRRALKVRILMAEALQRDGQHKLAMRTMARALEFAATEGFVQTFLEEGLLVEEMLRECAAVRESNDAESGALDNLDWLTRFKRPAAASHQVPLQGPVEALTGKELQVLELLAQGLTNNDMAEKLFVSESTVRTHLRNINAKLHADNRVQAVAFARRLNLIR